MHDPRRLLTLRAVVAAGSFSEAARALSLTQPAVSQQVAALEREVGARLLDRGAGGSRIPVPTEAGTLLLAHAAALAERLDLADAQIAELRAAQDPLRLGAYPSAMAALVPRAIAAMGAPRVRVTENRTADLRDGVAAGRLHAAVTFTGIDAERVDDPVVTHHELGAEDFRVLVGRRHRLAARRTVALAELADEVWTAPSTDGLVARACRAAGFEPDIAFVATDPLASAGLCAEGLAVCLSPRTVASSLPGVRCLAVREPTPRRAVFALTPVVGARPDARAFVDALRATWSRP